MIKKGNLIVQDKIADLDFYFHLPEGMKVYVKDLEIQGYKLIKEADSRHIKLYPGNIGNKSKKVEWLQHLTHGEFAPKTLYMKTYNGVKIYNYTAFDPDREASEEEMMEIAEELQLYNDGNCYTGCHIISSILSNQERYLGMTQRLAEQEEENYDMLGDAMRGGANAVLRYNKMLYETHVDYHQLYASCLLDNDFPYGSPIHFEGYKEAHFGIYKIGKGKAQLKPEGFPILSPTIVNTIGDKKPKMFGADGRVHDLRELGSLSSVDLQLLFDNYDVEDFEIVDSLVYPMSFNGQKVFGDFVDTLYQKRKTTTGSVKRFYKLVNEFIAGFFERTIRRADGWWTYLTPPPKTAKEPKKLNPVVGIFITAYGRQKLNGLLHMFKKKDVIGFDTDCVFFKGPKEKVPQAVLKLFGEGIGQLHYDGIYKDVIHLASKRYYGYDLEKNENFRKMAGESKSGKTWYWDAKQKEYILKEAQNGK